MTNFDTPLTDVLGSYREDTIIYTVHYATLLHHVYYHLSSLPVPSIHPLIPSSIRPSIHPSSEIEELHRMPVPGVTIVDYGGSPIVIEFLLRGPIDSLYAGTNNLLSRITLPI